MINIPKEKEIVKDLLSLYIKTSNAKIENLFIKLSLNINTELSSWLKSNKGNIGDIGLKDESVYYALLLLAELKDQYPVPTFIDCFRYIMDKPQRKSSLPIILSFGGLLSDPEVGALLNSFSQQIMVISKSMQQGSVVNSNIIKEDLIKILRYMETKTVQKNIGSIEDIDKKPKISKKQKALNMFYHLYNSINNEIANAAASKGWTELENKIRNEGVLIKTDVLKQYINVGKIDPFILRQADRMAKYVMGKLDEQYIDLNYSFIKEKGLNFVDAISNEQLDDLQRRRMEKINFSDMQSINMDINNPESIEPLTVDNNVWLSPDVLCMFSVFFNTLLAHIAKL